MSGPYRDVAAPTRPCPRCCYGLVARPVGTVRIDECPSCEGVFVGRDVLPRLLDPVDLGLEVLTVFEPGTPSATSAGPMYVKCPRCRGVMNRRQFATGARVVVDVCREHGMWFDTAELRAVVAFASSGGLERAAQLDAERADKERREAELDLARLRADVRDDTRHTSHRTFLDWLIRLFT